MILTICFQCHYRDDCLINILQAQFTLRNEDFYKTYFSIMLLIVNSFILRNKKDVFG